MLLPPDITLREHGCAPEDLSGFDAILSADERERMHTFAHAGRRRAFAAGRIAARLLLAERLSVPPEAVPLRVAQDGAVEVEGAGLYVSIAHSGTRAVAAVSSAPVGIDIEQNRPRHEDLYRFLLHPDEYPLLDALPYDRTEAIVLCWVLKEATLKALRTGLRLSPKRLRLDVDAARTMARVFVEGGETWQAQYERSGDYLLAVAYRG